jgi:hypothetical protein
MGIANHIEELHKEQNKAQRELDAISALCEEFPDLETDRDRWGRIRYMAKSANARVTDVLFHRNCGCCADSPIHARPYLKLANGTYIYSNPCNVMIGSPYERGNGFQEYKGWRKTYEDAGVNPAMIEKIQRHIEYQSEEDDDDDDV